jgi:hypothetical protein
MRNSRESWRPNNAGDAPRALDLVGRSGDLRPEPAGAGDWV